MSCERHSIPIEASLSFASRQRRLRRSVRDAATAVVVVVVQGGATRVVILMVVVEEEELCEISSSIRSIE
jgi:hypothetical protein